MGRPRDTKNVVEQKFRVNTQLHQVLKEYAVATNQPLVAVWRSMAENFVAENRGEILEAITTHRKNRTQ